MVGALPNVLWLEENEAGVKGINFKILPIYTKLYLTDIQKKILLGYPN